MLTRDKKNDAPVTEAQRIERMLGIANEIIGVFKTWRVRWVGIEGFAMAAAFRAHQVGEVAGVVKSQLWLALKLVPEIVAPSAARKHVMGYGRPDKRQVVEVVREGLGHPVKNDHEADASVVARYTFDKKVAEQKEIEP